MKKKNLDYFKISKKFSEPKLDKFYIFDYKDKNINIYIQEIKKLKEKLITLKTLISDKKDKKIIEDYLLEIQKILKEKKDFVNVSEFISFVNACDNTLESVQKDIDLLEKILKLYFEKRILNEKVPEEWVQSNIDSHSSRKKGSAGENKLISILKKKNFILVDNWKDFEKEKFCVAKFSKKKDGFNLKKIREKLKIQIKTKKQGKMLDLLIKANDNIFILEAKHLKISGGAQDKQMAELIEILKLEEKQKNIFYISFLDGVYSNLLLSDKKKSKKIETQREEIEKSLKNGKNFWLNTKGFERLINDLID